jgi:hypothetical protein
MAEGKSRSFRTGIWLLSRLVDERKHYGLFGDIEEIYDFRLKEKGQRKADIWLWLQVTKKLSLPLLRIPSIGTG